MGNTANNVKIDPTTELQQLKTLANRGDRSALNRLGLVHLNGLYDTEPNLKLAFHCFQKSAALGHYGGLNNLGYCYKMGIGTKKNYDLAIRYFKQSAEAGNIGGIYNLASSYETGVGVNKNYEKAYKYYSEIASKEDPAGMNGLGWLYIYGTGVELDKKKGFQYFKKSAKKGDANGLNCLGFCYQKGIGTEMNNQKAFQFYQKSADLGFIGGMVNVAGCYFEGIGTNVNYPKAFECFKLAAILGDPIAMNNVAFCYISGKGPEINLETAYEYFFRSSETGYVRGMFHLGLCYQLGIGTKIDQLSALHLLCESRHQVSLLLDTIKTAVVWKWEIEIAYAILYCISDNSKIKNPKKSQRKFYKAAISGNPLAELICYGTCSQQHELQSAFLKDMFNSVLVLEDFSFYSGIAGVMMFGGIGTEKDKRRGIKYLQKERKKGNIFAKFFVEVLKEFS